MSTIIMRSALLPGGLMYHPDRDVGDIHHIEIGWDRKPKVVTRKEVNAAKEKRLRDRLDYYVRCAQWHAVKLWVAYFGEGLHWRRQTRVHDRVLLTQASCADGREGMDQPEESEPIAMGWNRRTMKITALVDRFGISAPYNEQSRARGFGPS